jgi:hypothetical protein
MPELTNTNVGSFFVRRGALGETWCPFPAKKSKKVWRIWEEEFAEDIGRFL